MVGPIMSVKLCFHLQYWAYKKKSKLNGGEKKSDFLRFYFCKTTEIEQPKRVILSICDKQLQLNLNNFRL